MAELEAHFPRGILSNCEQATYDLSDYLAVERDLALMLNAMLWLSG